MPRSQATLDPSQIQSPAEIPPPNAPYVGLSPQGLVDVYRGTLPGDVDALPSAKELLGAAQDTGGLSNADYIVSQVGRLYGGAQLPPLQSPSGSSVRSLVFVSGSSQGGFGAFHIGDAQHQADFDRIVVDSLNASGNYSNGSHFGLALESPKFKADRLFPKTHGPSGLLGLTHLGDSRVESATFEHLRAAHQIATHCIQAVQIALEACDTSSPSAELPYRFAPASQKHELARQLVSANQELIALVQRLTSTVSTRQYLSTALFAAEIIESFQTLTQTANPGRTDGEAVSRVVAYKLTPEVSLVPGFNSAVTQQWWQDGHPDYVNVNTENDQSTDGNAAGVMFLLFLTDYLGLSLEEILKHMPKAGDGAPLGDTFGALVKDHPDLVQAAGADGKAAFGRMIDLLTRNAVTSGGLLNLPANGNPFPSMQGSMQGGVFSTPTVPTPAPPPAPQPAPAPSPIIQEAQAALSLETQLEQQLASLKSALQQIQGDVSAPVAHAATAGLSLRSSTAAALEQQVATFRASQYDQTLQTDVWPQLTRATVRRLQVITGTPAAPDAVSISGTVTSTAAGSGGGQVISFQPDDPGFPTNHSTTGAPLLLVVENINNPFDASSVGPGTRLEAAGPLVFDRTHGRLDGSGQVLAGLQIDPLVGLAVLTAPQPPVTPPPVAPPAAPVTHPAPTSGQLTSDLASALGQAQTLAQTVANLTALIQKMQKGG